MATQVQVEHLQGTGVLQGPGIDALPVSYSFRIETDVVIRPNFPVVRGKRSTTGSISTANRQRFPDARYQLTLDNGEVWNLQKLFDDWHRVA